MKKNSLLRLKLHRETLRTLAGGDMEAAQGGATGTLNLCSAYRTCGCPVLTDGCPTMVQNCTTHC